MHYVFGGDAAISRSLARWIVHHDDNASVEIDGDTMMDRYYFDDELIVLEPFRNVFSGPKCTKYATMNTSSES